MIIQQLEYKYPEEQDYTTVPIRFYSGSLVEATQQTPAGILYVAEISGYVVDINPDHDALINMLAQRPATYRVKDTAGHYHLVGNENEPATLTRAKRIDPKPGSGYGYDIKISCSSVNPSELQSFSN